MTNQIHFTTKIERIGTTDLLVVPREMSAKLPSRGQVLVHGTLNKISFLSPLEPDGKGSHWLKIGDLLQQSTGAKPGDVVSVEMESTNEWPEPNLPNDLIAALEAHPIEQKLWQDITPMARWDWLRWINSTKVAATRAHRIEVALSKLRKGTRRPCCFNRTMCTDPEVSKSGVLLSSNLTS